MRRASSQVAGSCWSISFGPTLEVDGRSFTLVRRRAARDPAITEHAGVCHGIQAYLTPLGARRLFGMPMGELDRRAASSSTTCSVRRPAELAERLYEARDWPPRFALLERAIAARVLDAPPVAPDLEWAWRRLIETAAACRSARWRRSWGWSRRHLAARSVSRSACRRRRWRGCCGSSTPSSGCARGADLAELALDCGYYDQAHFNRDFRQFAGRTPTEYLVTSVQDISAMAA